MKSRSSTECKWIPKEELWQTVHSFREQYWHEGTLPVDMEKIVEQRLRLNVEPIHSLLDNFDVDAFLRLDLSGIVVDYDCFMKERFQNRIRFSFAHEVGLISETGNPLQSSGTEHPKSAKNWEHARDKIYLQICTTC